MKRKPPKKRRTRLHIVGGNPTASGGAPSQKSAWSKSGIGKSRDATKSLVSFGYTAGPTTPLLPGPVPYTVGPTTPLLTGPVLPCEKVDQPKVNGSDDNEGDALDGSKPTGRGEQKTPRNADADAAWQRLRTGASWTDWLVIGEWLLGARNAALHETGANAPQGRAYAGAFGRRLDQRTFAKMDQGDRARLFKCMENRDAIEEWRATLTLGQRIKLNHPSTVLRQWKARTQMPDPSKPKKPSPMAKLHDAVVAAEERANTAERALIREAFDVDWQSAEPADIANRIAAELGVPERIRAVAEQLLHEATAQAH
jgi:hypothetical protein